VVESLKRWAAVRTTGDVQELVEGNTRYLRDLQNRLPQYWNLPLAEKTEAFIPGARLKRGPLYDTVYWRQTPTGGNECVRDNIATLRVMGKLAAYYHKKIYVYFGPEGRPANQKDAGYTLQYKLPIMNAVKDLPSIRILDLTSLPLDEDRDLYNFVNLTYAGNSRVADKMFDFIRRHADDLI